MSNDEWTTPPKLYNWLNSLFNFDLDAAASKENTLCKRFLTKEDDAIDLTWNGDVFCNPPYSRDIDFALHAMKQVKIDPHRNVCLLLPVRADRIWFQKLIHCPLFNTTWITGRLHFGQSDKGAFMYSILVYQR